MSCGTIANPDGKVTSVVVAGGIDGQGQNPSLIVETPMDLVEVYNIEDGTWTSSGMRTNYKMFQKI